MSLLKTTVLAMGLIGLAACGQTGGSEPTAANSSASNSSGDDPWAIYTPWDTENPAFTTTESGLQYVEISSGPACESGPTDSDRAIVHYEGRLVDGTVFDSSLARGEAIDFPANGVIRGWTEALALMCPGDDWMVYLPSEIAYGQNPRPGGAIKPGDDLVFRVILLADVDADAWSGAAYR